MFQEYNLDKNEDSILLSDFKWPIESLVVTLKQQEIINYDFLNNWNEFGNIKSIPKFISNSSNRALILLNSK